MTYSTAHKTARMTTTRDRLNGGALLLLNAGGSTLCSITLNSPSGTVSADILTFSGFPKTAAASSLGDVASAKLVNSTAGDEKTGLTVGVPASAAPAWSPSTAYTVGQVRTNGSNVYRCTGAGTSAGSGGPTGTGASISDGSAVWAWLCVANAQVQIDNGSGTLTLAAGATVTVSGSPAPTIQHAA
jgi:hypothetical protein